MRSWINWLRRCSWGCAKRSMQHTVALWPRGALDFLLHNALCAARSAVMNKLSKQDDSEDLDRLPPEGQRLLSALGGVSERVLGRGGWPWLAWCVLAVSP